MNRVWVHRDPHNHATAPAALETTRAGDLPSHEVQALHARVEAYREARLKDQRELAAWRDSLRRLVEKVAPLELHNLLREQPDFQETAQPADWLAIGEKALVNLRAQLRKTEQALASRQATPSPPAPPVAKPSPQSWRRQPATLPLADAAPIPSQPESGTVPDPEQEPEEPGSQEAGYPKGHRDQRAQRTKGPDNPKSQRAKRAEGQRDQGTKSPSDIEVQGAPNPATTPEVAPECPHQGTPWFRHWKGEGSLANNLELLRARLRQWGIHNQPSVPDSIKWRNGDGWIREMIILCLMAETGMAPTRQLALALTRLAAIGDPFKKAGAQNLDLQSLTSKQLIETTQLQVSTGKGSTVPLNVAWLTEHGRDLMAEHTIIKPVENEWQRLDRLHGGAHQLKHNSRVMLTASGFRTWGWDVTVLPDVEGAQPDLLVTAPGLELPWPVEVEAGSGSAERRHAKWRAVTGLNPDDPRICLIAPDPHSLLKHAKEIRESAPKARMLCADLRSAFRLPSSLAAAQALDLPLLHLEPGDRLQPLTDHARAATAAAKARKR